MKKNKEVGFSYVKVEGKWHAEWMACFLYLERSGNKINGEFKGGLLEGILMGTSVTGTWFSSTSHLTNKFEFSFDKDANYIQNGFWDRGTGYGYTRKYNIKGRRDGVIVPQ